MRGHISKLIVQISQCQHLCQHMQSRRSSCDVSVLGAHASP